MSYDENGNFKLPTPHQIGDEVEFEVDTCIEDVTLLHRMKGIINAVMFTKDAGVKYLIQYDGGIVIKIDAARVAPECDLKPIEGKVQ